MMNLDVFEEFSPHPALISMAGRSGVSGSAAAVDGLPRRHSTAQEDIRGFFADRHRDATGLMPTRTAKTIRDYRETVARLVRQADAPGELETIERLTWTLTWFARQNGRWKPAVIRHHRAALLWAVETLSETIDLDLRTVQRLIRALDTLPIPRSAAAVPRTSAKKRLDLTEDEVVGLVGALCAGKGRTARLLAAVIGYGVIFGLRPREFRHVFVIGNQLIARSGKHTNGRGIGRWRYLDLIDWNEPSLLELRRFLTEYKRAARRASSWDAFSERFAKALTRACDAIEIPPISPYTLRHQALANAKVSLSRRAVAAFAGHLSQQSASRYYPLRRGGWKVKLRCRPSAASIACVKPLPRRPLTPATTAQEEFDLTPTLPQLA